MRILVLPSLIPSGRHTACCAEPKGWSATFNVLSSVVYLRRGGGQSTEGLVQGGLKAGVGVPPTGTCGGEAAAAG